MSTTTRVVAPGDRTGTYYILISNLPFDITWHPVKQWISAIVKVDRVEVFPDSTSGWIRVNGRANFDKAMEFIKTRGFFGRRDIVTDFTNGTESTTIKEHVDPLRPNSYQTSPYQTAPPTQRESDVRGVSHGQNYPAGHGQGNATPYAGPSVAPPYYSQQPWIATNNRMPPVYATAHSGNPYNYASQASGPQAGGAALMGQFGPAYPAQYQGGHQGGYQSGHQNAYQNEGAQFTAPHRGQTQSQTYSDGYQGGHQSGYQSSYQNAYQNAYQNEGAQATAPYHGQTQSQTYNDGYATSGDNQPEYRATEQLKLHISPFPQQADKESVVKWIESRVGKIKTLQVEVPQNENSRYLRGHAFATFTNSEDAKTVMGRVNKSKFGDQRMKAKLCQEGVTNLEVDEELKRTEPVVPTGPLVPTGPKRTGRHWGEKGRRSKQTGPASSDKKRASSAKKPISSSKTNDKKPSPPKDDEPVYTGPVIAYGSSRKPDKP